MIVRLLFSIFESFWRRALGSGDYKRFVLHVINISVATLYLWYNDVTWLRIGLSVPLYDYWYWNVGHGCAFDIGRDGKPDSEMIKRYEKYFWDKWCKFIVPESCWYGFWYDYLWMMFRYGIPAVLISVILGNWLFGYAGFGVATTYAVCWSLNDKGKTNYPIRIAEYISGFISGLLL